MPIVHHLPTLGQLAYMNVFYRSAGKLLSFKLWWTGNNVVGSGYNADTACAALYTNFHVELTNCLNSDTRIFGSKLSVRDGIMQYSGQNDSTDVGNVSGGGFPDDVNAVLRRLTDIPGPSGRGRLRIAGVPLTFGDGNYVTSAAITAYAALITKLKASVTDQGIQWSPAVFSTKLGQIHAMIDMKLDTLLGTDRRRRPRF